MNVRHVFFFFCGGSGSVSRNFQSVSIWLAWSMTRMCTDKDFFL